MFEGISDDDLPSNVKRCTKYEYVSFNDSDDADEYYIDNHLQCKNCLEGYLITGKTLEDLYASKRNELLDDRMMYVPKTSALSKAPPANDDLQLFSVTAKFGDHSDGLIIEEIIRDDKDPYIPHAHFFFQPTYEQAQQGFVPREFEQMIVTETSNIVKEEEQRKKVAEIRVDTKKLEARNRLIKILS